MEIKLIFLFLILPLFFISCDKSFDVSNPFGVENNYGYEEGRCLATPDCGSDDLGCNTNYNTCEDIGDECNDICAGEKCLFIQENDLFECSNKVFSIDYEKIILNKNTSFTIYGRELKESTAFWIESCENLNRDFFSKDKIIFKCTPTKEGYLKGIVKTNSSGRILYEFEIDVNIKK
jgi:hypothetical protein